MKEYRKAEITIVYLQQQDIVTTSVESIRQNMGNDIFGELNQSVNTPEI